MCYIIQEKRTPKESPKQQNYKYCRLGLFEPVHERYCKVQAIVVFLF